MAPRLQRVLAFFSLFFVSCALITNFTIDDSNPDPRTGNSILYSPAGVWNSGTLCIRGGCSVRLDKNIVNNGTWHESTTFSDEIIPHTATVQFDGMAVYVFCVLVGKKQESLGNPNMSFALDGQAVGVFTRQASTDIDYEYNVLVYSNSSLSIGPHELTITSEERIGEEKSIVVLDRIVYSFYDSIPTAATTDHSTLSQALPTNSTTPTVSTFTPWSGSNITNSTTSANQKAQRPSTPLGTIIGTILGSLATLFTFSVLLLLRRRRQRQKRTVIAHAPVGDADFSNHAPPDGVLPFPVYVHPFMLNHTQSQHWAIASDSKQTVLDSTRPPPSY